MRIFIDADGCPVVKETIALSKKYNKECIIICDTSHHFDIEGAKTITVSKGENSADFRLVNLVTKGDVAITQDYALAAMCLAKGATAINQNGLIFNDDNILSLLNQRHMSQKIRRSGGRLKAPVKRDASQTENFIKTLEEILKGIS